MFDDPAVRSVRVALALCERFEELLKGPTTVRAAKQRGALVGVAGDQEGLSMRIGEAQQIYPEIWQHLDEAREVFAKRGIDTSMFDGIRQQEGQALGANVDIQHSYGYGSHGVDQQMKTAGFNRQGLARARRACQALMDATPDIQWAAIAKAEGADPAAAEFARSTRNKRYLRLAALALLIFAPFGIVMYMRHQKRAKMEEYQRQYEAQQPHVEPLAAADRAALVRMTSELKPQLTAARKAWYAAFDASALAAIKLGTAPCVRSIQAPPQPVIDAFVRDETANPAFASTDFYGYPAAQVVPDGVLVQAQKVVDGVSRRLANDTASRYDRDTLAAIAPYITVVLIDNETGAALTGTGSAASYTPGQVLGRAYVFSVRDAKIVCAGSIDARNLPAESSPYLDAIRDARDGREILHREMEVRIRQSLATALHAP